MTPAVAAQELWPGQHVRSRRFGGDVRVVGQQRSSLPECVAYGAKRTDAIQNAEAAIAFWSRRPKPMGGCSATQGRLLVA